MNITEKNSFSSTLFLEEAPDKKARKESFILILEDKLAADDEKSLPQWKTLLYALTEVNAKKNLRENFITPSFATFLFDKVLTKAVKLILSCKKFVNKEFNQVLDTILVQTLLLWSKILHDCPFPLWKIVYDNIFELDNPYYKIEKSMLDLESSLETPAEHFAWLQTLKKGDIIDCVKIVGVPQQRFSVKVWSHAEIISVNDKSMKVSFIKDSEKPQEISKTASCHEIAPYKTKCDDFDWRMGLQTGDVIDACDTSRSNKWYHATVIETRENLQGEKEVLVGFRTYSEDGNEVDSKGRKCFGYLERSDRWFNATSPFIAKNNLMTKDSTFDNRDSLDDSLDMIFKPSTPEKTIYAVYQKDRCESITFVNIINQFGEQGGFDNISQALLDKTNPVSVITGQNFCRNLAKLDKALHRTFVKEYAVKLQEFWAHKKEGVKDQDVDLLGGFLMRVYSSFRLNEIWQSYNSPKAPKPPKPHELEQMNTIARIEYLEQNGLPQEYIENSEKRNRLFYLHEYDIRGRKFTMEQIARLWAATKPNDHKTINSMGKDIIMIYYNYYNPDRTFYVSLVDHLFETNPEDLAELSLELLMKIFKNATEVPEGYHQKFYNFLQRSIYTNLEKFSYGLVQLLNTWFARLSNDFLSGDEILQILYKYTDNVAQHTLVLPSLNLIGNISGYEPKTDKKFSQRTYIEHLCQEKDLLTLVLQEFRLSKETLIEKTQGQKITVELLESLLPMGLKYLDDYITGMISSVTFLHTRCPGNRSKLDILKELWDITIKNALIPKEKESLLTEIRDIMVSKEGPHMKEDELKSLMKELNCIQSPSDLIFVAYECYMHLFVTLHEKLENIYDVRLVASDTQLTSFYGNYRYEKFVGETIQIFEFKVRVPPETLEGFDQIWKFMLFSEIDQVLERAADFHAMVYSNVENEFRTKGERLWQSFFTTVKKHLNEILENKESVPTELLNKRLSRCLKSVMRMLYRTERSLPREFQPHWKLNNKGTIRVWFQDMNREDKIQINLEQTVRDLLDEYEKKKGVKVDNQVALRESYTFNTSPYHKRYLPLYEAVSSGRAEVKEDKPVLGFLVGREKLDPRAKAVFTKWFEEFSTNGKMSPDQFGIFLQSVNRDIIASSLVKETFETYDKDRDGFLTLENFLAYYQVTCDRRPLEVWGDIATRGEMYGSKFYEFDEFGKVKETGEPEPEITPSLRSQMALDKELLELFYSILKLEGPGIGEVKWLLERLPTNPKAFGDLVTLRGVREMEEPDKRDWEQIFTSKSPIAFLYILDIIDYLFSSNMEDDNPDETRESMSGGLDIWAQNPELLEYKRTWCQDFIELGGSKHLSRVMEAVQKNPHFAKDDHVLERMEKTTQQISIFLCFYTEDPKAKKLTL